MEGIPLEVVDVVESDTNIIIVIIITGQSAWLVCPGDKSYIMAINTLIISTQKGL